MSSRITIVSASTRSNSQSLRMSKYLQKVLDNFGADASILDLNELKLPVYDDSGEGAWKSDWDKASKQLEQSDGFVVVSPEWGGMASIGWFNMLHYVDKEMAHKPVVLVGVSSGMGGAYPLAQMKSMGQKNKHFVLVPENLRLMNVEKLFVSESVDEDSADKSVKLRAEYTMKMLIEYAHALGPIRHGKVVDLDQFGFGA